MTRLATAAAVALSLLASAATAQETRSAVAGMAPPAAKLADLAWLAGEWVGKGISGEAHEAYSPPVGGVIVGHFVQADGKGGVAFYELMEIAAKGGSLVYRLRHFNPGLVGWEEKAEVEEFPLVAVDGGRWFFDGLTIRRDGPDGMVSAVLVRTKDGRTREYVFAYRRLR